MIAGKRALGFVVNCPLSILNYSLIQRERDCQREDDVDRFAVQRAWMEAPLLDGIHGLLAESERQAFEYFGLFDFTLFIDDCFDDDDAGDASFARGFAVVRFGAADRDRRFDVAANAERSRGWLRCRRRRRRW